MKKFTYLNLFESSLTLLFLLNSQGYPPQCGHHMAADVLNKPQNVKHYQTLELFCTNTSQTHQHS